MAEAVLDLAYMICTTPRTGATALLGMLRRTAIAGYPVEYPDRVDYKGIYGVMVHHNQLTPTLELPPAKRYAYIHLYRKDIVAQAVSWNIAAQTSRWRSYQAAKTDPVYDSEGISFGVKRIQEENKTWTSWLENKSPVLKLPYETLSEDYTRGTLKVLSFLGLPKIAVEPPISKIGNNTNIEWAERWKEENRWQYLV